jgi:hypothetical protein
MSAGETEIFHQDVTIPLFSEPGAEYASAYAAENSSGGCANGDAKRARNSANRGTKLTAGKCRAGARAAPPTA